MIDPALVSGLSALMFVIGLGGAFTRKNAIIVLMCIELMLNAANMQFAAAAVQPSMDPLVLSSLLNGLQITVVISLLSWGISSVAGVVLGFLSSRSVWDILAGVSWPAVLLLIWVLRARQRKPARRGEAARGVAQHSSPEHRSTVQRTGGSGPRFFERLGTRFQAQQFAQRGNWSRD